MDGLHQLATTQASCLPSPTTTTRHHRCHYQPPCCQCKQVTTDLPMYRHLRGVDCENGGGDYDKATRGLGGNPGGATGVCSSEVAGLPCSRGTAQHCVGDTADP